MAEQELRERVAATVNILGSIASITGVSLLWLKGRGPFSIEEILSVAASACFALGLATTSIFLVRKVEARLTQRQGELAKWGYRLLAYPIALVAGLLILLLTNKLMINSPFDWFLR